MATASQPIIPASASYVNIVSGNAALSGVDVQVQNLSGDTVDVVCTASNPQNFAPITLRPLDSVRVNATAIWVRGGRASATVL